MIGNLHRRGALLAGAGLLAGCALPRGAMGTSAPDPMLADLKQRTFRFFWDTTNPRNGLARDRWPTPSFASIAAVGFALTAYPVGVERGWITRGQALERTLATLRFFDTAPQGPAETGVSGHRGFFYHFLDMETGLRFEKTELSTIDTTLLLGGVLFAQAYFDRADAGESEVRRLADRIYGRVDWTWIQPREPFVSMGWHPENRGAYIRADWDSFNEAALLYVLALASPTHPLPASTWDAWTSRFTQWGEHWGQTYLHFAPMFGHQYSHVWVDFRGVRDRYMRGKGIDYFENSRRAAYAQQTYAVQNAARFRGYGREVFGLTACDGPGDFTRAIDGRPYEFFSYSARGPGDRDDGTLSPTALGGSVPFAPEIILPALAETMRRYGSALYGKYGFLDSYNPTLTSASAQELKHGRIVEGIGWVDGDYLGIDQGPILLMIENYQSDFIWKVMRRSPHIRRGLERAGFTGGWLERA